MSIVVRSTMQKFEHAIDWIAEGASVRGALKHVVQAAVEHHQLPTDTYNIVEDTEGIDSSDGYR